MKAKQSKAKQLGRCRVRAEAGGEGAGRTVGLEVAVDDALGVQVVHALRGLARDVDQLEHVEPLLEHVQQLVERGAVAPLRDDGQLGLRAQAHEQQDVHVPRAPQQRHLVLERLEQRRRRLLHVELLDGDRPVPPALVHCAERAAPDALLVLELLALNTSTSILLHYTY